MSFFGWMDWQIFVQFESHLSQYHRMLSIEQRSNCRGKGGKTVKEYCEIQRDHEASGGGQLLNVMIDSDLFH